MIVYESLVNEQWVNILTFFTATDFDIKAVKINLLKKREFFVFFQRIEDIPHIMSKIIPWWKRQEERNSHDIVLCYRRQGRDQ